ncbi:MULTISPECIES: hypothetical protein [Sphingomonas]|jgi:hypothetical protein|nr:MULTISPECIES: hypothetical protein [Sphingomonas]MDK8188164.1 hypothetical protein [Sphingomonas zeae]MDK8217839.1 hypothetical protein [Sphingomonas sp. UMB7805-LC452B]
MTDVFLFLTGWTLVSFASGFLAARCIPASGDDAKIVFNHGEANSRD